MIDPKDILINGKQLSVILENHKKWILSQKGGEKADLSSADLRSADLSSADLRYANLRSANLSSADLSSANLRSANLSSADLSYANLSSAKNNEFASAIVSILPEGEIIGWKKARTVDGKDGIVMLKIPQDARRSNATGRKCRAEFAEDVKHFVGGVETTEDLYSTYDNDFCYKVGKRITPNKWDENRWDECSNGVHFFITRIEAEQY